MTELIDKHIRRDKIDWRKKERQEGPAGGCSPVLLSRGTGEQEKAERASPGLRAAGALALGVVFALSFVWPVSGLGFSICIFRNTFGIPCPGCGMTRSFAAVSHGQIEMAFRMHLLGPFIYAGFAFYMVKWTIEAVARRRLLARLEDRLRLPVLWCLVAVMICVWVWRLASGTVS